MKVVSSHLTRDFCFTGGTNISTYRGLYLGSITAVWLGFTSPVCPAQRAAKSFRGEYAGTVGGSPIRMTLQREGARVTGTYRYVHAGVSLRLEGTWQDDRARMQEIYGQRTQTGVFTARVQEDGRLEGAWTKPDGTGALSFHVQPLSSTMLSSTMQAPAEARRKPQQTKPPIRKREDRLPIETRSALPPSRPERRSRSQRPEETSPSVSDAGGEFLRAVRQGDTAAARNLLERDERLTARDKQGRTALMLACSFRNDGLEGASFASLEDRLDFVKFLLARRVEVNARDVRGYTPLMYATASWGAGDPLLHMLLDAGAEVNARNKYGGTALMIAAGKYGHVRTLQLLIEAGADVNLRDNAGHSALWAARTHHTPTSVRVLEDAGAVE